MNNDLKYISNMQKYNKDYFYSFYRFNLNIEKINNQIYNDLIVTDFKSSTVTVNQINDIKLFNVLKQEFLNIKQLEKSKNINNDYYAYNKFVSTKYNLNIYDLEKILNVLYLANKHNVKLELKEKDLINFDLKFLFYNNKQDMFIINKSNIEFLVCAYTLHDNIIYRAYFKNNYDKQQFKRITIKNEQRTKKELKYLCKVFDLPQNKILQSIKSYKDLYLFEPTNKHQIKGKNNYWTIRNKTLTKKEQNFVKKLKRHNKTSYYKEVIDMLNSYYSFKDIINIIVNYHNIEQIITEIYVELNYNHNDLLNNFYNYLVTNKDLILEQQEQEQQQQQEQQRQEQQ